MTNNDKTGTDRRPVSLPVPASPNVVNDAMTQTHTQAPIAIDPDPVIAAAVERIERTIAAALARRDAERTTAATMQKIAEGGR